MALPTASDNAFPSILITEGTEPSAPAAGKQRLYIDSTAHKVKITNSSGVDTYVGTPSLLLDYALAADISNQALTAGTYFDMFANQNFTVVSATSLIEVSVRGYAFCNDATAAQYLVRVNIDSAGTPVLKYVGAGSQVDTSTNKRSVAIGGSVYVSGLSAATHTIKVQFVAIGNNDHLYCRASTNGPPTTGAEFLNVQVIEHP